MKKTILIFLLVFAGIKNFAQNTWIETEFSANIWKELGLSISPQVRFKENFDLDEYFIESAIEYKFHKYFQLGAGYRFGYNINKKGEHESFGRFHIDAKTGIKLKKFNPKFRLRYSNSDDFADDNAATKYLRYKLELEYQFSKLKMEPYILYEWYQNLDVNDFEKTRFEGGLMKRINKHHKVGAYFRTNNYLNSENEAKNIIGIVYKFNL